MKAKVKEWYLVAYPTDEMGAKIEESTTFSDVLFAMINGKEPYDVIGVYDSIIRERIFAEIAKRMGTNYNAVYNIWLKNKLAKEWRNK